jgi:Glycosyl hydrolase family 63 C-terminal domain
MVTVGSISLTTTPEAGSTAGAKTDCSDFTDRECRLCFALGLWNGRDPILKERLFGLTGSEGNHGEDVKENYYYLDATPTYSYARALYKYPQVEFPYRRLVEENRRLGSAQAEFELAETGAFDGNRYFDVQVEYAKAGPDDLLIRISATNCGPQAAPLHILPTLWFRNTWSWQSTNEASPKPFLRLRTANVVHAEHDSLGTFQFAFDTEAMVLFTENETNAHRLWGTANPTPFVKDAFHEYVIAGRHDAVNHECFGTKCAPHFKFEIQPGETRQLRLRLVSIATPPEQFFGKVFDSVFAERQREADEFYAQIIFEAIGPEPRNVLRQGYAGLLWSKQFYHYVVADWLAGDSAQPQPPPERRGGRNREWEHVHSRDIISMPDKWEYPWFAAWDLAFHMIPMTSVDPDFAKQQLMLLLREWYMHPNGQIPAYEFAFGDVNPPVHAWAAWRVYELSGAHGQRDRPFLESVFQKLLLNFTWWVNRKDAEGNNLFQGGFLGLDNIGVFDRSNPLPNGGLLQQSDGTAWMAFYCLTMLSMALELAQENSVYEDLASKFFEHFVRIADAMNNLGGTGLWDATDEFYYDQLKLNGQVIPLRSRSLVGLLPLIAVEILEEEKIQRLPGFWKRMKWLIENRPDLARLITWCEPCPDNRQLRMLAIPSRKRLESVLRYMLDESEFLSPFGIRSVSAVHREKPYIFRAGNGEYRVDYSPGEGTTYLFGGNSNWRGPIWFPINYLLIEALECYDHFYGEALKIECPVGSGRSLTLNEVATELSRRLTSLFLPNSGGSRPCHGGDQRYAQDPNWRDLVLFHEYFHAETGRGCGASHQTGWTSLVLRCLEHVSPKPASSA